MISNTCGIFIKVNYIQGHKMNLDIFKVMEIIKSKLFDYNGIKLGINDRKTARKSLLRN